MTVEINFFKMYINIDILTSFHESWMIWMVFTVLSPFQDASNLFRQASRRPHFCVSYDLISSTFWKLKLTIVYESQSGYGIISKHENILVSLYIFSWTLGWSVHYQ